MIVAKLKLRQIQRQILFADMVEAAHSPALQKRPERFDVVGMNLATDVFALTVAHGLVWNAARLEPAITGVFISSYQVYIVTDSSTHKAIQRSGIGILDYFTDDITFATDSSDDSDFAGCLTASLVRFLIPMAVLIFPADEGFIDLDNTHKLAKLFIVDGGTQPMTDIPSGVQGGGLAEKHPPKLTRGNAFLALEHRVENFEPSRQRNVGIFKHSASDYRETVRVAMFVGFVPALPMKRTRRTLVDLRVTALRADRARRPTAHGQINTAGGFIRERGHELLEGHHAMKYTSNGDCSQVP
jgi:hypothetical protein